MNSLQIRLTCATVAAGLFCFALASNEGTPAQQPRSTTDPPVASGGMLGQDLFLAVDHRDLESVQALLKRGADPNAFNGLGFYPLYIAAASHQPAVMHALLEAGARPDAESSYGTALLFAAGSAHLEGVKILLARGAKPDQFRSDGMSVLMMAANAGSPDVVAELFKHKLEVDEVDDNGTTALMYAARNGHLPVVQMLVKHGAKIHPADQEKQTALMAAAVNGHAEVAEVLIKAGAPLEARDAQGRTALVLTSQYGDHPRVVQVLLAAGADPKSTDAKGRSAATWAASRGYSQTKAIPRLAALGAQLKARPVRPAVEASLSLLQSSMQTFTERAMCVSCHHEGLGRMVTGAARARGFAIREETAKVQSERLQGMLDGMRPLHEGALQDPEVMKQVPLIEINEVTPVDAWLLSGIAATGVKPGAASGAMTMVLARQQNPAGFWGFSLPRVPMQSSQFTFTALSVHALDTYGPTTHASELKERLERAKQWLLSTEPKSSEDRASRVMGLAWAGVKGGDLQKAVASIKGDQRPDGGWSQLPNMESDAYATGQALVALRMGGVAVNDSRFQRGVQFLLRTQDEDGSWFVNKRAFPGNNYFDAGFPHGLSQYSSFNGTCWATLALLQTLPTRR